MSSILTIERYGIPTKLDQFSYGTACKVSDGKHDHYDLYLQVNDDEEDTKWELLGSFNSHSLQSNIDELVTYRLKKNIHYD